MRRRKLRVSRQALRDLYDAYEYAAVFDPIGAKRLLNQISAKMESIARLGLTGASRGFISGLRAFPFRDRCIYFLIDDSHITVLRILHGRKDTSTDDFPESEI